ncbi:hypothetical protein G5I_07703 [Acromyrmex echinatior]|uniref:Uncharacterized protein n=1 Tax=Acromyrmex echinatior TaxID=103372 RepID=F4WPI8_ACREC|nr:hypothetical protein G5I_07703 [Acromyrmex echinatior]
MQASDWLSGFKERVNPLRFSAASTVVRFPKTCARPDERLQRSEFCSVRVKGMPCPAWSMQHVFLSPAGYVAAAQMYNAQRSGRNRGMDFRWNSQMRKKRRGGEETLERYPRRLCTVSMNYAKGDSLCRLLVDLDVERRYLHVASDSRLALYSLDKFQREKGRYNRVSAAGGGSGGGLDLDLASLIRFEGGQPPLCDSVWGSRLLRPVDKSSPDNSRNLEFEENSLENRRFCSADTRHPMGAVFLAYLTAASAAAFATKNERMDREENGPQRERREAWRGRASKAPKAYFGESDATRGYNCANLVYTAGSSQKSSGLSQGLGLSALIDENSRYASVSIKMPECEDDAT